MAEDARSAEERLREFMIRDRTKSVEELKRPSHEIDCETVEGARHAYGDDPPPADNSAPGPKEVYGDPDKLEVRPGMLKEPERFVREKPPDWSNDLENEVQLEKERAEKGKVG